MAAYLCLQRTASKFLQVSIQFFFLLWSSYLFRFNLDDISDGNGGLYECLDAHCTSSINTQIKYFHVYGVDNVLCRVTDPHFIGYCIKNNVDCAAKVRILHVTILITGNLNKWIGQIIFSWWRLRWIPSDQPFLLSQLHRNSMYSI